MAGRGDILTIALPNGPSRGLDLRDFLRVLGHDGEPLVWRLFPCGGETSYTLDGTSSWAEPWELENRIETSACGVPISWESLQSFAEALHQTIWGTFLACSCERAFDGLERLFSTAGMYIDEASPEFYERVSVAMQVVDSSHWLVYVQDERLRSRFRSAFCVCLPYE